MAVHFRFSAMIAFSTSCSYNRRKNTQLNSSPGSFSGRNSEWIVLPPAGPGKIIGRPGGSIAGKWFVLFCKTDWPMQIKQHKTSHLRYAMVAGFILMGLLSLVHGKGESNNGPARFASDDRLELPASFRKWVFLGAAVTPHELNNGHAPFPGIHYLYIEPTAFEHYLRTGEFRDGTMLAKELVAIESREAPSGRGYFPGRSQGLGISLKSRSRHPEAPDNWGFYYFGSEPPYATSTMVQADEACAACHRAGDRELVFSRYYPALNSLEPRM
jgi:hypothetical protein